MNLLTTPIMYGLAGLALAAGVFSGVQTLRLAHAKQALAETKQIHAEQMAAIAELAAKASDMVRDREHSIAGELSKAAGAYERGKADAQATGDVVERDLRAGNLRLRKQWQGCLSTSPLAGITPGAGRSDDAADLRSADSGDLVRVGASCDAQVAGAQAALIADRQGQTP